MGCSSGGRCGEDGKSSGEERNNGYQVQPARINNVSLKGINGENIIERVQILLDKSYLTIARLINIP